MLSQNIAKTALLLENTPERTELYNKLDSLISVFTVSHTTLENAIKDLETIDPELTEVFDKLGPSFDGIVATARQMADTTQISSKVQKILSYEDHYLPIQDELTGRIANIGEGLFAQIDEDIQLQNI